MSTNPERNQRQTRMLSPRKYGKLVFFSTLFVMAALILDTSLTRTSDILVSGFIYNINLIIFIVISVTFGAGQFLFLRFVKAKIRRIQGEGKFYIIMHKVVTAIQYALTAILAFVILQLVAFSQYNVMALIVALTISYSLGAVMMLLLARHFLSWFRLNKDLLLLLYGISAITLAFHLAFTLSYVDYILSELPATVRTPYSSPIFLVPGSLKFALSNVYVATSILSFAATWAATALLLHNYSEKLGQTRYWAVVSLPLVYFLSQFPTFFFEVFNPLIRSDPVFYGTFLTILFSLSKPAGGILFAIGLWSAARRIRHTAPVRGYLIISAYGFVLLFTADQGAILIHTSYPPFGLATILFMGLSSYLIFNGISYSAMSVAQDAKVRREIKQFAKRESKLLDSIGSAQFEQQVQEKLAAITQYEDEITRKIGVQHSVDEEEAMDYLEEVLKEKKSEEKSEKDED